VSELLELELNETEAFLGFFLVNRKESHRDTDAKTGSPEKCTLPAETLRVCVAKNTAMEGLRAIARAGD